MMGEGEIATLVEELRVFTVMRRTIVPVSVQIQCGMMDRLENLS